MECLLLSCEQDPCCGGGENHFWGAEAWRGGTTGISGRRLQEGLQPWRASPEQPRLGRRAPGSASGKGAWLEGLSGAERTEESPPTSAGSCLCRQTAALPHFLGPHFLESSTERGPAPRTLLETQRRMWADPVFGKGCLGGRLKAAEKEGALRRDPNCRRGGREAGSSLRKEGLRVPALRPSSCF